MTRRERWALARDVAICVICLASGVGGLVAVKLAYHFGLIPHGWTP